MLLFEFKKTFDRFTLDIAGQLSAGITALVGPSGSGKTTLLNLISGLRKADSGKLVVFNRVLYDSQNNFWTKPQQRPFGYVFQYSRLFSHMTVRENIQFPLKFVSPSANRFTPDEVFKITQIHPYLDRYPSQLSGGEQQRVALARALMAGPEWLLLDEPMGALDIGAKLQFLHFLKKLHRQHNLPMLIVSHDLNTVMSFADEVLFIRDGKIRDAGKPFQVMSTVLTEMELEHTTATEWDGYQPNYHNIVEMRVEAFDTQRECLIVSRNKCQLFLPQRNIPVGTMLVLHIPSNEIILAIQKPQQISANTVLKGRISRVEVVGNRAFVTVQCGIELVAEVVPGTVRRLSLQRGKEIYLILKATAIRIIDRYDQNIGAQKT